MTMREGSMTPDVGLSPEELAALENLLDRPGFYL